MPQEKSPIINAIKKIGPAVVSIVVSKNMPKNKVLMPFGLVVPSAQRQKVKVGGGSGFIVDPCGIILTNRHVVSDPNSEYTIVTSDEKKYKAKVLARDPINDIAIIKINAKGLPHIKLGNSSQLELGQSVIAVGNALGTFKNTVSTGIVSGLSRFIHAMDYSGHAEQLRGLIQTDAALNPGNSGGPLVDIFGQVIGINSAVVLGAQNIGFVIPINAAKKDLTDLKRYGRIMKPSLGLRYVLISKDIKEKYNLPVSYGALVMPEQAPGGHAVLPGGPAARAGIKPMDIILEFGNKKVTKKNGLLEHIENCKVGEVVKCKILRNGQTGQFKIKLGERK